MSVRACVSLASGVHLAARAVLGAVLGWAGIVKVLDRQAFVVAVDAYGVLPRAVVPAVAAALPWIEIVLAAFLVLGLFVRFAGGVSAVLLAAFLVVLIQAKARGLAIDCGCFGGGGAGAGVTWWDIIRDVPLLLGAAGLTWRPHGPLRLDARLLGEG